MGSNDGYEKPKKQSNSKTRSSTIGWIKQVLKRLDCHEKMIQTFEESYDQTDQVDPNLEPVHILCIDGGGMKGVGLAKMVAAIQERCQEKGSFLHQFDLICGTSVGGICALLAAQLDDTNDAVAEAEDALDDCRERVFLKMNVLSCLTSGKMVKGENSFLQVFEDRYGSNESLYNPDGIPVSVLCGARTVNIVGNDSTSRKDSYEPFILRSYDYPEKQEGDNTIYNDFELAKSSSSVRLIEAMAATSAVPGLVDRVRINVDGKDYSCADGFVFANSPVAIALNEARRLYPKRPLGVFMSIGFERNNAHFANRAISIARLSHPNLHFQRICPVEVFANFKNNETSLKKIADLEERAFDYVANDIGLNRLLDVSLDKLFAPGRSVKKWQAPCKEEEKNNNTKFRKSYLRSKSAVRLTADYQRRTQERLSILNAKSNGLKSYTASSSRYFASPIEDDTKPNGLKSYPKSSSRYFARPIEEDDASNKSNKSNRNRLWCFKSSSRRNDTSSTFEEIGSPIEVPPHGNVRSSLVTTKRDKHNNNKDENEVNNNNNNNNNNNDITMDIVDDDDNEMVEVRAKKIVTFNDVDNDMVE